MSAFQEYWDREAIRLLKEGGGIPSLMDRCHHAFEAGRQHELEKEAKSLDDALKIVGEKLRAKSQDYLQWKTKNAIA